MADITVSYKGSTIAEVSASGTTTLGTSGKYCEDDISIAYTKPSGGAWNWIGKNATKISNFADYSVALKDTDFNTWTPSTTQTQIVASATVGTFDADMVNYDYTVVWKIWTDLVYGSGVEQKNRIIKQLMMGVVQSRRIPKNWASFQAKTLDSNNSQSLISAQQGMFNYYDGSGSVALGSATYGFYFGSLPTFSFSGGYADDPTVTVSRPPINTRCYSTYFSTTAAAGLDKTNSKLYVSTEVFRAEKDATLQAVYNELMNEFLE